MSQLMPIEKLTSRIYTIRGQKVMISLDLAELYGVEPRILIQAVKRNIERFPEDFMFQLTDQEFDLLKSQFVISTEADSLRSQNVILKKGRGRHSKYSPYAFTEQGVAMLSSVLRSKQAVMVNVAIMRAFVKLREMALTHRDLAAKINSLEKKYDAQFKVVFEAIRQLMAPEVKPCKRIGFRPEE